MSTVPWLLQGRTGRWIGGWLDRHGWELTRVIRVDGMPLARVRITPGRVLRAGDVDDLR